jgi:hypothetical protein
VFDRTPDNMGFAYWMDALRDGTTSISQIATALTSSAEFTNRFAGMSNTEIVESLYRSNLGRAPTADERPDVNYWASVMIAGRGNALLDFSEAEEHHESWRRRRTSSAMAASTTTRTRWTCSALT